MCVSPVNTVYLQCAAVGALPVVGGVSSGDVCVCLCLGFSTVGRMWVCLCGFFTEISF